MISIDTLSLVLQHDRVSAGFSRQVPLAEKNGNRHTCVPTDVILSLQNLRIEIVAVLVVFMADVDYYEKPIHIGATTTTRSCWYEHDILQKS